MTSNNTISWANEYSDAQRASCLTLPVSIGLIGRSLSWYNLWMCACIEAGGNFLKFSHSFQLVSETV